MNLSFDTGAIPVPDRVAAFRTAFNAASKPAAVQVSADISAALLAWDLGLGTTLVRLSIQTTELRVNRTQRHLRLGEVERLSLALNLSGDCFTSNHDRGERDNDKLRLTDLSAPYGIVQRGRCTAYAVEIDNVQLGLTVDQIRAALPHATSSPLHRLFCRHLLDLVASVDQLDRTARAQVGAATHHLTRGLLNSVSPNDRDRRAAAAETLSDRVEDYIRRHLADPDLTPARVAEAHHISLRYLYVLLAAQSVTPAEWIVTLRLAAARSELRSSQSVASVASHWGFRNHSHFTRRFKAAYGMTPTEFAAMGRCEIPSQPAT